MNLGDLIQRTRVYTGDPTGSIFLEEDIKAYLNEAVDRVRSNEYFTNEQQLSLKTSSPVLLPNQYHYLLAVYATARCFEQDERYYQATQKMNEFETKFEELVGKIAEGTVVIKDADGNTVEPTYNEDFVVNDYFIKNENDAEDYVDVIY